VFDYEQEKIEYYLRLYTRNKPDDAFLAKAEIYGMQATVRAIKKAYEEGQTSIVHITDLIGKIVREGRFLVYKSN